MRLRTGLFFVAATALFPGCDCDRSPEIYKRATYAGAGGIGEKAGAGGGGAGGAGAAGAPGAGAAGALGTAGETAAGSGGAGGLVVDENGCTALSKLVYLLSADRELFRFDPPTLTNTKVGKLDCANTARAYSMAVSRNGTGYAVLQDGTLQKFDVATGSCQPTPFVPGIPGFARFGMGFASKENADETLFVTDAGGLQLGKIDVATYKLTKVGEFDQVQLQTQRSELTGNSAGELFAVFSTTPATIAQIDPLTAKIISTAPQQDIVIGHFAFAAYGGQFWTFTGPPTEDTTDIYVYDPLTKLTEKKKTIPEEIVGAGVSTCAPRTLPGPT